MPKATITIRNYRCFGQEPEKIEIGPGFTAIVGPNNAGKTAILKFIYELRNVWGTLANPSSFINIAINRDEIGIQFLEVLDQEEVYNHHTPGPITFDIDFGEICFHFQIKPNSATNTNFLSASQLTLNKKISGSPHAYYTGHVLSLRYQVSNGNQESLVLTPYIKFFDILARSIYIPAFRNIINIGENRKYYDINTGTAFINEWKKWKGGPSRRENLVIQKINDDIRDLLEFKDLEINASEDGSTLKLAIDKKPYSIAEVGSGITQFILTFANVALKKPTLLLIDEPELNLHPSLQIKFLTNLASYTDHGVIFATHSIGLARSVAEKIYSIVRKENKTEISDLETTKNYVEFLGELSFSSYQEIGANKILLVEGPTEVKTFQQLLRKVGKDKDVIILNLGGSVMITSDRESELSEITRFGDPAKIKIFAWIDSERTTAGEKIESRRQSFITTCKKLNIDIVASERRAIENYFPQKAITDTFGDTRPALSEFEMLKGSTHWAKKENWRIAREINLESLQGTDLGKFIYDL